MLLRKQYRLTAALVAILALVLGVLALPPQPPAAHALGQYGAGAHGWAPNSSTWLGNFILPNGIRVYCTDIYNGSNASSDNSSVVTAIPASPGDGRRGVSGNELRWLNYLVTVYGQTSDAYQAAAVSALVYNITSQNNYGTDHYISVAPQAVRNLYWSIKAAVNANYLSGGGSGNVNLDFHVDPQNNYVGTLSVTGMSPSNATGTITLTNGIFTDTGSATRTGVTNNSVFPVRGVPPAGQVLYKISAQGAFSAPGGYSANIRFYRDGSAQGAISAGTRSPMNFTHFAQDPMNRSTLFRPVVTTQVSSKFVAVGDEFADVLTFGLAADANGHIGEWQRNAAGRYAPITARGALYGPFLEQPAESALPPVGAPVAAANVMVTTDPVTGPTVPYTVPSGHVSQAPGFYTWVWEILASDQPAANPNVRQFLPDGYHFRDRFGQVIETSITPAAPVITTQVTEVEVQAGMPATDEVTLTMTGGTWLQDGGSNIPVTLTGTAYYSDTLPVVADTPPPGAEVVGTTQLTFTGDGTLTSAPITMPVKTGWVTFQWCLRQADQPTGYQGMFQETCDRYGQATETLRLTAPKVTTRARELVTVHDPIFDIAIVSGEIPADMELIFEVFQKPVAGDPKWVAGSPTGAPWTDAEIAALGPDPACVADNLVATTTGVPVTPGVNSNDMYQSPDVLVPVTGEFWWVERLIHVPTGQVLVEGTCGLPSETSRVSAPKVRSQAVNTVVLGEPAYDTAIIEGPIPAAPSGVVAELTFQVFRDRGGTPVCDASTLVKSFNTPIVVTGAGDYQSPAITFTGLGRYHWVEQLEYVHPGGTRELVHRGTCGVPSEMTIVRARGGAGAALAFTGTAAPYLLGGVGGLLIVAGVVVLLRRRKYRA